MKLSNRARSKSDWRRKLLRLVNLRPEEGERTFLMFVFYTLMSIGLLWLEQSTVALFLGGFGAKWLPVIYIASAVMGSGLGFLYTWLQENWPLPKVLLAIAFLMTLPLVFFRVGLDIQYFDGLIALATVFLLRLWIDAEDILNNLNCQVTANQLFNIREIKRTYPIISSGLLLGDVISGFSLPILLLLIGLKNVIITASIMMLVGTAVLYYLTKHYKHAFPDTPIRELDELQPKYTARRTSDSLRKYTIPLFAFFILGEILYLLVEFQYLRQLEVNLSTEDIAGFLGLFAGVLGLFELFTQWFVSSRAVERLGVFIAAMFLPISLSVLGLLTLMFDANLGFIAIEGAQILFFSALVLKFFDELLRYTLIAGIEPFLFQPIPSEIRSSIQAQVQGIAEPLSTGLTGGGILTAIGFINWAFAGQSPQTLHELQGGIFVAAIVLFSLIWAGTAWLLRAGYVNLLVQSAEQGRLGFGNVDLKAFKRAIVDALSQPQATDSDRQSCIQLLQRIEPKSAGEILAPLLVSFSPPLQRQSLETMLQYPNPAYLAEVQKLIDTKPNLEIFALALRYVWLAQADLDTRTLKPYLHDRVDPMVRGTAASLILRQGSKSEKHEATVTLERMLTSKREKERVIGTQALKDVGTLALIQHYLPSLLQDESARVRCAALEVIALQGLSEYYLSLIKGMSYKSTREAARKALVLLGSQALPLLVELTQDSRQPDPVRLQGWNAIAEIGTPEALSELSKQLLSSWGINRRNLLRVILKVPGDAGIEAVLEELNRESIETFIEQELLLLAQIYAASLDFQSQSLTNQEADLLRAALRDQQKDIFDRCFLLMKLLYPASSIEAAALNLESNSASNIAMGLEILDNILDIPQKQLFLNILDSTSTAEKLEILADKVPYQPLLPKERLRRLMELRHFLSDWLLACCFHVARSYRWNVTREATLVGLRHPTGFVREAVLTYLKEASPRICLELLPMLKHDPNPLVAAQVAQMKAELESHYHL
ncbi:MAG: hypothetical protein ACOC0N_00870 [Chroococcales cyanobacterium]